VAAGNIDNAAIRKLGVTGPAFGEAQRSARLGAIERVLTATRTHSE